MSEDQKNRLAELQAKASDCTDAEKSELELLELVDKQTTQITEKDSLLGKRATELGDLKKERDAAVDGKGKDALVKRVEEKEEALDIANAGLKAMKDAQEQAQKLANIFPGKTPGNGDGVDPAEVAILEKKAKGSEESKAAVELAYGNMTADEKRKFKSDNAFKKQILEMALPDGDLGDDTPWGDEEETGGVLQKTDEDRLNELFGRKVQLSRNLPPGSSGRPGHPGFVPKGGKQKRSERQEDTRTY